MTGGVCCADAPPGHVICDQLPGEGAGSQGEEGAGAGGSAPGSGRDQQGAAGLSLSLEQCFQMLVTSAVYYVLFCIGHLLCCRCHSSI